MLLCILSIFIGENRQMNFPICRAVNSNSVPRYFKFNCSSTISLINLENPSNWTEVAEPTSDHVNFYISEIVIYANESTYIYSSGAKNGKPKVDVASAFQNDLLTASGLNTGIIEEVFSTDYEFYTTSERCN